MGAGVEVFQNAVIVLEADPLQKVHFQVFPDPIMDSKGVQWADIGIVGRSEPIKVYHGSSARQFNFTLTFVASVDAQDDGSPEDVKEKVEFCQSLAYPQITRSGIVAFPPVCLLIIGNMINSRTVMKNIRAKYSGPWNVRRQKSLRAPSPGPFGPEPRQEVETGPNFVDLPLIVEVAITMEEVNVIPDDSVFVRKGRKI